ncbi:MDR family MFS transporter [Acidimangrovimonas sediminis]|uniref:MDR family MFS transporter n=1 Tax=Acidimangrovimonas sediminis TaxID=2056283 RepID=UPI000C806414|nr:MDR family MFS transporter [Acidimangrovimonas sediminis]
MATAPAAPAQAPDHVPLKTWIAVGGAMIGAFMAVLNIQVTNSSLPDIEGGIGTGGVNGAWISTAYLIGEIIVIPLTGFLSRVFSLRRYLIANTVLFLIFSAACGQATSLGEMVMLRAIQGFTGGVLIPLAFTIVVMMLPPAKRPVGFAAFAVTATFAPSIGPTIGGWLTDHYGWPTIFYMNLVPGAVMLAALVYALPASKPNYKLLAEGDWLGIFLIAVGLAAFQTMLNDGNTYDWFGSTWIITLAVVSVVSLYAFLWVELTVEKPLLPLGLLLDRNFGLGTLANVALGFTLYGASYLLPQYLAVGQGLNAEQSGKVMAWTGLPQLLIIPFSPLLMKKFDPRVLVGLGLGLFALSCFMNMYLDPNFAGPQFFWPDVIRAVGQALAMTPMMVVATASLSPQQAGDASGMFNMLRNLGGAIGVAMIETFYSKREQFHSFVVNSNVSQLNPLARERLQDLQHNLMANGISDPSVAMSKAQAMLGMTIKKQAVIMGYGDAFGVLGVAIGAGALCMLFLKKPGGGGSAPAH